MSGFGFSMVFVIFHDNVDYYWARSRVLERMNVARVEAARRASSPCSGPTPPRWAGSTGTRSRAKDSTWPSCARIQDWYIRYQLNAVEGVSEVASIGGHVKQYQIDVDPVKMRAHGVTLAEVTEAVRKSNIDVGAKVDRDQPGRVLHPRRRVHQEHRRTWRTS